MYVFGCLYIYVCMCVCISHVASIYVNVWLFVCVSVCLNCVLFSNGGCGRMCGCMFLLRIHVCVVCV